VGFGAGEHLHWQAVNHPRVGLIGAEPFVNGVAKLLSKIEDEPANNIRLYMDDARDIISVLPDASLGRVFVLFPDPWPKLRHHKHRIIRPSFLHALAQRSTADARLYFRTDFVPYFEAGQTIIAAHPEWQVVDEPWPFEFETVFQSRADSHYSLVARRRLS
jgi:tRNA (guanine-N7-)-methyltransferase